jgi:hypothetical protein
LDPQAKGTKSINVYQEDAVHYSDRSETLYKIAGRPWLLLHRGAEFRNIMFKKE